MTTVMVSRTRSEVPVTRPHIRMMVALSKAWDESLHPREAHGRWTEKHSADWHKLVSTAPDHLKPLLGEMRDAHREALNIEDPDRRGGALGDVAWGENARKLREVDPRAAIDFSPNRKTPLSEDRENARAEVRARTGEPDIDFKDPVSIGEWMDWQEKQPGGMTLSQLGFLAGLESRTIGFNRAWKPLRRRITRDAFKALGMDPDKMGEGWTAGSTGDEDGGDSDPRDSIDFSYEREFGAGTDEPSGITLTISRKGGIRGMAEIGGAVSPAEQGEMLRDFLTHVRDDFPADWNKKIGHIEGSDIDDIVRGRMKSDITVYRMMSPKEYEQWENGGEIPKGKYFGTHPDKASGTDFGTEGERHVYSFKVPRHAMAGEDNGVVMAASGLRMNGRNLTPVVGSQAADGDIASLVEQLGLQKSAFILMVTLSKALNRRQGRAGLSLASVDERLSQEMAKCARDYDQAKAASSEHAGQMDEQAKALVKQADALRPQIEAMIDGKTGLTPEIARKALDYLSVMARLRKVRQGRRISYNGANREPVKPEEQPGDMSKALEWTLVSKAHDVSGEARDKDGKWTSGGGKPQLMSRNIRTPIGNSIQFGIRVGNDVHLAGFAKTLPGGVSHVSQQWETLTPEARTSFLAWSGKKGKWGEAAAQIKNLEANHEHVVAKNHEHQQRLAEEAAAEEEDRKNPKPDPEPQASPSDRGYGLNTDSLKVGDRVEWDGEEGVSTITRRAGADLFARSDHDPDYEFEIIGGHQPYMRKVEDTSSAKPDPDITKAVSWNRGLLHYHMKRAAETIKGRHTAEGSYHQGVRDGVDDAMDLVDRHERHLGSIHSSMAARVKTAKAKAHLSPYHQGHHDGLSAMHLNLQDHKPKMLYVKMKTRRLDEAAKGITRQDALDAGSSLRKLGQHPTQQDAMKSYMIGIMLTRDLEKASGPSEVPGLPGENMSAKDFAEHGPNDGSRSWLSHAWVHPSGSITAVNNHDQSASKVVGYHPKVKLSTGQQFNAAGHVRVTVSHASKGKDQIGVQARAPMTDSQLATVRSIHARMGRPEFAHEITHGNGILYGLNDNAREFEDHLRQAGYHPDQQKLEKAARKKPDAGQTTLDFGSQHEPAGQSEVNPKTGKTVHGGQFKPRAGAAAELPMNSSRYHDVGEKIGGARKDIAAAKARFLERQDANSLKALEKEDPDAADRTVTKAALWTRPSVADMQKSGDDPWQAAIAVSAWSTVAPRPEGHTPADRERYRAGMATLKEFIGGATGGGQLAQRFQGMRSDIDVCLAWMRHQERVKLGYTAHRPPEEPTIYQQEIAAQAGALGKRFVGWLTGSAKVGGVTLRSLAYSGERIGRLDGESKEKAVARGWEQVHEAFGEKERATPDEAKKARIEKWKWTPPTTYERKGGKPIKVEAPEDYIKRFGLRGVEFGNWMDNAASKAHVERCAEAFSDMADGLAMSQKDVSLNGRLALAFGARGSGGSAAHYEQGKTVINLTKLGGAGSLGHEWGHFLDDMMARLHPEVSGRYATEMSIAKLDASSSPILKALAGVMHNIYEGNGSQDVPLDPTKAPPYRSYSLEKLQQSMGKDGKNGQKLFDAYVAERVAERSKISYRGSQYTSSPEEVVKSMFRSGDLRKILQIISHKTGADSIKIPVPYSQFLASSGEQEGGSPFTHKGYWTQPHELFARAFEMYLEDRLKEKRRANNYLVHVRKGSSKFFPYPHGQERARLKASFDKLIDAVHTEKMLKKALDLMSDSDTMGEDYGMDVMPFGDLGDAA